VIVRLRGYCALLVLTAVAGCGSAPNGSSPHLGTESPGPHITQVLITAPGQGRPTAVAGRLVTGFPSVVPLPPGAHVTASAVQPRGDLLAVSVTGTSRQPLAALLHFIRTRLIRVGFTATDNSLLPPGASDAAFGRQGGAEMLIVAVVDRGDERSFSIGGTVSDR
jgi:hypothetical protein